MKTLKASEEKSKAMTNYLKVIDSFAERENKKIRPEIRSRSHQNIAILNIFGEKCYSYWRDKQKKLTQKLFSQKSKPE